MSKRPSFSQTADLEGKSSQSHDSHDDDRCSGYNCPLRADIFTDGRGRCIYHYLANAYQKDADDVSERVRRFANSIKTAEKFARMPMTVVDGITRGIRRVQADSGRWHDVVTTYPDKLPIGEKEPHGDWVDRARSVLVDSIVRQAKHDGY